MSAINFFQLSCSWLAGGTAYGCHISHGGFTSDLKSLLFKPLRQMLLLPPQSCMAPVCLTFKIPAKFLAEIRTALFIKSISLHNVGGLEKNTSSVTGCQGNIYLLNLASNTISQYQSCLPRVMEQTTSALTSISIRLVYTLSGSSRVDSLVVSCVSLEYHKSLLLLHMCAAVYLLFSFHHK